MPYDAATSGQHYGLLIGLLASVIIIVLRNRRPRPLRIAFLWVRPVILLAVLALMVMAAPPSLTPINLGVIAIGGVAGAGIGWQRGRFMHIEVDPQTHAVTSRASVLGVLFILGILATRILAGSAFRENDAHLSISPIAGSDALLTLVVAMMSTQGLEMWLRARQRLAEARAANKPFGQSIVE